MAYRVIVFIVVCLYMPFAQGCSTMFYNIENGVAIKEGPFPEGVTTGKVKMFTYNSGSFVIFENDTDLFVKNYYNSQDRRRWEFFGITKKISDGSVTFDKSLIKKYNLRKLTEVSSGDARAIARGEKKQKGVSKHNKIVFWASYSYSKGGDLIIEFADYRPLVDRLHSSIKKYDGTIVSIKMDANVRQFIDKSIFVAAIKKADTYEKLETLGKIAKHLGFTAVDSDLRQKHEWLGFNAEHQAALGSSLAAKKAFIEKHSRRTASGDECFVVTASSLNIRKRHYGNADNVGVYSQGDVVCRQATYDGWVQTDKGWISSKYLKKWGIDGYTKKISEMQIIVDSEDFALAKNANTVASYAAYLADHPAGKYESKASQLLAARYVDFDTFEGFMSAYKITGEKKLLVDAYGAAMKAKQEAPVSLELVELYFAKSVEKVGDVPGFAKLLAQIDGYDDGTAINTHFRDKIYRLPAFGKNLTVNNFADSVEYKYVLKDVPFKLEGRSSDEKYIVSLNLNGKKSIDFFFNAECKMDREISRKESSNIAEALFGVKSEVNYYDVYVCAVSTKDINSIQSFVDKIMYKDQILGVSPNSKWEDFRFNGKSHSISNGGSSSGNSAGIKYSCKFCCEGQWGSCRSETFKVKTPYSNISDAQDYVKDQYEDICKKYPFYEGGGGTASVGFASCDSY